MKSQLTVLIMLSVFFFISSAIPALGAKQAPENFEFRVEPIFPDSQLDKQGYYHLAGTPGEAVTLQAWVTNESESPLHVTVRSLNAYSGGGGILYEETPQTEGSSITNEDFEFKTHAESPAELSLAPLESKVMEFTVKVPDITGTLLGSMEFRVFKGTDELSGEENSQLLIDQYKAVNIGVQIDVGDVQETPKVSLADARFSPEQAAIMMPMENNLPIVTPEISGTYEITSEENPDLSITGDIPAFKMAPMTNFSYPYRWTNETLEPGTYEVRSTITINGQPQTFDHTITIENDDVTETRENLEERGEIQAEPKTFPWLMVVVGLLALIIVILIAVVLKLAAKNKK